MHVPAVLYQMEAALAEPLTPLRPAQRRRGLALWVYGAVLARSACQSAVVAALTVWAPYEALRQRLREWLYDGADKAAPWGTRVAAEGCFGPLLGWVLRWWQGRAPAPAIDATTRSDRVTALVVAVLYRGGAIPVARAVLPGNTPGGRGSGPSCACWSGCSRRCWRRPDRGGACWFWPTAVCGARGCGRTSVPSAGTRCCACKATSPSPPMAGSGARPRTWCGPVRPGSAAAGWARPRSGGSP